MSNYTFRDLSRHAAVTAAAAAMITAVVPGGASASSSGSTDELVAVAALADIVGLATTIDGFEPVDSVGVVDTGSFLIDLPTDLDGRADRSGLLTVNGDFNEFGDDMVVTDNAFAVITDRHEPVEFRFDVDLPVGTSLVGQANGDLFHVDETTGAVLGIIGAAFAVDEGGVEHPASYRFDAATGELVMVADTTNAVGSVLIDPSWRCWATIAGYGVVGAAGVILFYMGSPWAVPIIAWVTGLPQWKAFSIYRACS